ncbi:MAG: hypothetical protein ABWZ90_15270, partial [Acidimicrobiales bacterium]
MRTLRLAAVLLAAGLALSGCADDDPPEWLVERAAPTTTTPVPATTAAPSTTVPHPGRELAVIDLEPGVCIEDAGAFTGTEVNEITQTQAIACRLPHEAEVYLRQDLPAGPDDPFPGVGALRSEAQELCRDGFE